MSISLISEKYSQALVEVLRSAQDAEKSVSLTQLESLCVATNTKEARKFLLSPVVDIEDKLEVLNSLAPAEGFTPSIKGFLKVLAEAGRLSVLSTAYDQVRSKLNELNKIEVAVIESPSSLGVEKVKEISEALEQMFSAKFEIEQKIDEKLLGGYRVKIGHKIIDLTLASRVNQLTQCAII